MDSKPVPGPPARSMLVSQAAQWYRSMIPTLSEWVDEPCGDSDMQVLHDNLMNHLAAKHRLRIAAMQALYSTVLAAEFMEAFNIPSVEECLGAALINSGFAGIEEAFELAVSQLKVVGFQEAMAFPGTVGGGHGLQLYANPGAL